MSPFTWLSRRRLWRGLAVLFAGLSVNLTVVSLDLFALDRIVWNDLEGAGRQAFSRGAAGAAGWSGQTLRFGRAVSSSAEKRLQSDPVGVVPSWSRASGSIARYDYERFVRRFEDARGLPVVCLMSSQVQVGADPAWHAEWGFSVGVAGSPVVPKCLFPSKPIWGGFILNTLFYSGLCLIVLTRIQRLRCASRSRRGECRACGHPLARLPRCPECGAEVPRPARA